MATSYPTSLDSYARPTATDSMGTISHAGVHDNAYDAIEALQAKVGADSSAVNTSHDYKLSSVATGQKAVSTSGAQTVGGVKTFTSGAIAHTPQTYTPAGGATATLDLSLGNDHVITMPAGNITIAISNATTGQWFAVEIVQDDPGSRTVTWFSTIKWPANVAPTLTTTASKKDTFVFKVTGADAYDGYIAGQNL